MLEFILFVVIGAFGYFLYKYIAGLEQKYIRDLQAFSAKQGFQIQPPPEHSFDDVKFCSSHPDGMTLSYRRTSQSSYSNRYRSGSATDTKKSHHIVLELPVTSQAEQDKLAHHLDTLAESFQWSSIEKKLDGAMVVYRGDGVVAMNIEPPLYSQALSDRLQNLLGQAVLRALSRTP